MTRMDIAQENKYMKCTIMAPIICAYKIITLCGVLQWKFKVL